MTQEDKELLLKDLSARLPYYTNCFSEYADDNWAILTTTVYSHTANCSPDEIGIKPYLFPLSSMTEEQKLEIKSLCDDTEIFDDGGWMSYISILGSFNFEINLAVVDWYNKNHFDYRGLIPMGLAIDATGLNVY